MGKQNVGGSKFVSASLTLHCLPLDSFLLGTSYSILFESGAVPCWLKKHIHTEVQLAYKVLSMHLKKALIEPQIKVCGL